MSYAERKAKAREEAIEWQHSFSEEDHYMSEFAYWGSYFEKLGKRYGLLREFRENGIINPVDYGGLYFLGGIMNQVNSIILEGSVTREPEVIKENGIKGVLLNISVSRVYRNSKGENEEYISYFDVKNYARQAELAKRCTVGTKVRVVGRLHQERSADKNGKTVSRIYVINEHIEVWGL